MTSAGKSGARDTPSNFGREVFSRLTMEGEDNPGGEIDEI
jgi:hypothetical protein